jgi:CO dehydrogenase maturation factor
MKISVCGKGGSGKSTAVTLLANEFAERGNHVLVVDSDESNSGLFRLLGFKNPPVPLMELVGGKKGLKEKMAVKFSSGETEVKMDVLTQDKIEITDITPPYIIGDSNLKLVSIGKIMQSLEGCACPMGVLSREFLRKLCLEKNEVVIVDMEAGVEHFGRGIETSIDSVLVVVEPSLESIELAAKIKNLSADAGGKKTAAILNKVSSDDIRRRIGDELMKRSVQVIGAIHYRTDIFDASLQGHKLARVSGDQEMKQIVDGLISG